MPRRGYVSKPKVAALGKLGDSEKDFNPYASGLDFLYGTLPKFVQSGNLEL